MTGGKSGGGIGRGCVGPTSASALTETYPGLIDGDTQTDVRKTCDTLTDVGFDGAAQVGHGCFRMHWKETPDSQGDRFSFAYGVDGSTWTRIGNRDQFDDQGRIKTSLYVGMSISAPAAPFK